jgi:hypothetical protein
MIDSKKFEQKFEKLVSTLHEIDWKTIYPAKNFVYLVRYLFVRVSTMAKSNLERILEHLPNDTAEMLFAIKILRQDRKIATKVDNDYMMAMHILEYRFLSVMHARDPKKYSAPTKKVQFVNNLKYAKPLLSLTEIHISREKFNLRHADKKRAKKEKAHSSTQSATSSPKANEIYIFAKVGDKVHWSELVKLGKYYFHAPFYIFF